MPSYDQVLQDLWKKALADAPLCLLITVIGFISLWTAAALTYASADDVAKLEITVAEKLDEVIQRIDVSESRQRVATLQASVRSMERELADLTMVLNSTDENEAPGAHTVIASRIVALRADLEETRVALEQEARLQIRLLGR